MSSVVFKAGVSYWRTRVRVEMIVTDSLQLQGRFQVANLEMVYVYKDHDMRFERSVITSGL